MNRIPFLATLTIFITCFAGQSSAQVIFNETFGQTTTRQPSIYMPASSYVFADPNGTSDQKAIENNYYAVVAPANIRDAWPVPMWWFWTGAEPVGNTWGGAGNAATPGGNIDHTGDANGAVLAVNAGSLLNGFYRRRVTLVPGNSYRLSAWMYLVNPSSTISMALRDPDDNDVLGSSISAYYSTTGSWTQLTYEFTFPSTCASAGRDVYVYMANALNNNFGNDYYIDDIILQTIPFTGTNVITCPNVLLDLKRIDLTAAANNDRNAVAWTADDEVDVLQYELQRSTNATNFETIYTETVATPNATKSYKYNDLNKMAAVNGRTYYRVKALRKNGTYFISTVASVANGKGNSNGMTIYPQPSSSSATVNVTWTNAAAMNVRVFSLSGGIVRVINNARGGNVRINDLTSGMYVVELTNVSTNLVSTQKLQVL